MSADREHPNRPGVTMPSVDHDLTWDPELSAAAGYVVASIMEWPALPRAQAITATLNAVADFYRIKFTLGTKGARADIDKIERAAAAFETGKTVLAKTAKLLIAAFDTGVQLSGEPVSDWQTARAQLRGTDEIKQIFDRARLLRLFRATDALAWALSTAWDGAAAYTSAAQVVREVLTSEILEAAQSEPFPVSLMSMHKSKGKEFDGVIIAEGEHDGRLIDPQWPDARIAATRRLLRVAITRARMTVVFVRPHDAPPLIG